jgi:hypothetical protein
MAVVPVQKAVHTVGHRTREVADEVLDVKDLPGFDGRGSFASVHIFKHVFDLQLIFSIRS